MKKSTLFFLLSFLILNLSSLVYGLANSNTNTYVLSLTSKNFDAIHTTDSYQAETKINTLPVKKDTTNYYNWIESKSLSSAKDLAFFMLEQFDFDSIEVTNVHDLALVHFALSYIDLFFATYNPDYLYTASWIVNNSLFLDINNKMIALDTKTTDFKVFAYDNLYLVLMYERFAKAFEAIFENTTANAYWTLANNLMGNITDFFYDSSNHIIKEYAFVSSTDWSIVNSSSYTTAEIAGLYSMASHGLKDPTTYHSQSYDVIKFYFNNHSQNVDLGEGFFRKAPIRGTDPAINDTLAFTGSIFLSSAYFYESKYLKIQGNMSYEDLFFVYGQLLLEDALAIFYNPEYNLPVSIYNITSSLKGNIISTFDCTLAALALREFNRYHLEKYGFSPGELAISIITSTQQTFKTANFYDPGLSTDQGVFSYKIDEYKKNPFVANSMAISMELKKYALAADLTIPENIYTNETVDIFWNIFWSESTNVFSYSNASFATSFDFVIDSELNFTSNDTLIINTFSIDGAQVTEPTHFFVNTTVSEGGDYYPRFIISIGETTVVDYESSIYVLRELRVYTDPSQLIATQGVDEYLEFSILCEDEKGVSVPKVSLSLTWLGNSTNVISSNAGSYDFKLSIKDILALPEFANNPDENPRFDIEIFATKDGYVEFWLYKTITIRRNALILELSQDLTVKRGNDLTLTIGVQPQIQTLVLNPKATIKLNDEDITNAVTQSVDPKFAPKFASIPIPLPAQISLPTKDLKENANLVIEVTSNNFPTTSFEYEIEIIPLNTFEAIYQWLSDIFSSTLGKILGSLSVIWAVLWKQFSLYVLHIIKRCPYCGETVKRKYSTCRYCGNIIDRSKYAQTQMKFSTIEIDHNHDPKNNFDSKENIDTKDNVQTKDESALISNIPSEDSYIDTEPTSEDSYVDTESEKDDQNNWFQ
ncbi:MAG: hypothetical protein K9W46_01165 [Candidatus Heimdallarchaeum endolithica]|uniref:Uncharacterized protein n=1 Tax=Candidatus Heimdallarchaeum endolithica TaxID=2876572 RepID=A0A9Y1BRD0_9ARCH|nr:MAG: hypothetical protein K9W46_01165 [Candidatus Heimdallarchaeum endolithica]